MINNKENNKDNTENNTIINDNQVGLNTPRMERIMEW